MNYDSHVKAYQNYQSNNGGGGMDYFGLGTAISGVANAITSGLINKKNFDEQKRQYENNMKFQREQFQYQKELNNKLFEREDNAVQRRMADIKATGLNPLMADATGGAQATAGHSTSFTGADAPQHDYNADILPVFLSAMLDSQRVRNEKAMTNIERERLNSQLLNDYENRQLTIAKRITETKEPAVRQALIDQYNANVNLINKKAEALGLDINIARFWGTPVGQTPTPTSKDGIALKIINPNERELNEPDKEPKGHAEPTKHDPNKYAVSQKNAPRGYGAPTGEQLKYAWYFDKKSGQWYRYGKLWYGE